MLSNRKNRPFVIVSFLKKTFVKYCHAEIITIIFVSFEPIHVVFERRTIIRCTMRCCLSH